MGPVGIDHDQLARRDLAHEGGADDAQRGRLRRKHPARRRVRRAEPAQTQRAEPEGVAYPEEALGAHEDEGEGALEDGEHGLERRREVLGLGERVGQQLGHDVAVGGDGTGQHADLLGQHCGVGQVAVVPEREAGTPDRPVDGLGAGPVRGAVRRIARVADGEMTVEAREGALVEHGRHQAHVLHDGDGVAVAHRHAGGLLAAVLQGEQPVEGQVGHPHSGRVDPEDTARFLHAHHPAFIVAQACGADARTGGVTGPPRRIPGSPRARCAPWRPGDRPGCPGARGPLRHGRGPRPGRRPRRLGCSVRRDRRWRRRCATAAR